MFRHMLLSMYVPVHALECKHECVFMCRNTHTGACVSASLCMCIRYVRVLTLSVVCLQEIANHMEKDTETYEVVQEAIDTMQRVAWHINDMKRKHEHAVRLQVRRHNYTMRKKQNKSSSTLLNPSHVECVISSEMCSPHFPRFSLFL